MIAALKSIFQYQSFDFELHTQTQKIRHSKCDIWFEKQQFFSRFMARARLVRKNRIFLFCFALLLRSQLASRKFAHTTATQRNATHRIFRFVRFFVLRNRCVRATSAWQTANLRSVVFHFTLQNSISNLCFIWCKFCACKKLSPGFAHFAFENWMFFNFERKKKHSFSTNTTGAYRCCCCCWLSFSCCCHCSCDASLAAHEQLRQLLLLLLAKFVLVKQQRRDR